MAISSVMGIRRPAQSALDQAARHVMQQMEFFFQFFLCCNANCKTSSGVPMLGPS
jgi:hypothetical protein